MRYLVAILFATTGAALAFAFAGDAVADWVAGPRLAAEAAASADAESLSQLAVTAVNFAGMLAGWALGAKLRETDEAS